MQTKRNLAALPRWVIASQKTLPNSPLAPLMPVASDEWLGGQACTSAIWQGFR